MAAASWTRLQSDAGADDWRSELPGARSGHALTLLQPTGNVLLFGGGTSKYSSADFFLLEPARTFIESPLDASSLQWKRLQVVHEKTAGVWEWQQLDATSKAAYEQDMGTREHHSMHYVPSTDEKSLGLRVLIVGNVIMEDGAFAQPYLRIEEVRIDPQMLRAQWTSRNIVRQGSWRPTARIAHCSALLGDRLYCFGGQNASETAFFNDLVFFDLQSSLWEQEVAAPGSRTPPACANAAMAANDAQDKLFIFGGWGNKTTYGQLWVYDLVTKRWSRVTMAPPSVAPSVRLSHTLTFMPPNHLVLFGGRQKHARLNDLYVFDIDASTWSRVLTGSGQAATAASPTAIRPRSAHAALLYTAPRSTRSRGRNHTYQSALAREQQLVVFGGYAGKREWLDDTQLLTVSLARFPEVSQATTVRAPSEQPTFDGGELVDGCTSMSAARDESPPVLSDITNRAQSGTLPAIPERALKRKRSTPSPRQYTPTDDDQSERSAVRTKEPEKKVPRISKESSTPLSQVASGSGASPEAVATKKALHRIERVLVKQTGLLTQGAGSMYRIGHEQMQKQLNMFIQRNEELEQRCRRSDEERLALSQRFTSLDTELHILKAQDEKRQQQYEQLQTRAEDDRMQFMQRCASLEGENRILKDRCAFLEQLRVQMTQSSNVTHVRLHEVLDHLHSMSHANDDATQPNDSPEKSAIMTPDSLNRSFTSPPLRSQSKSVSPFRPVKVSDSDDRDLQTNKSLAATTSKAPADTAQDSN